MLFNKGIALISHNPICILNDPASILFSWFISLCFQCTTTPAAQINWQQCFPHSVTQVFYHASLQVWLADQLYLLGCIHKIQAVTLLTDIIWLYFFVCHIRPQKGMDADLTVIEYYLLSHLIFTHAKWCIVNQHKQILSVDSVIEF